MKEQEAQARILQAARELVEQISDIKKITVRRVAERANVGIGLINHHFHSKDNLLSIAVGDLMADMAAGFLKRTAPSPPTPIRALKDMLRQLCDLAASKEHLVRFLLTRELLTGAMQAPLHLIPLLKEIFGPQKEEMGLRVVAPQILHPIQVAGISPEAFRMHSGVDICDARARARFIDLLVDNIAVKGGVAP